MINAKSFRARPGYWETIVPVDGSRMSFPAFGPSSKSNIPFNVPAIASAEPLPIRPRFQLSSMKRRTDA